METGALVRAHDSSQSIRPGIQAEALARAVAESMPGGVLVVDAAGVIALANRQIESQFGYSCAELVGQSIDILLPESSRAAHAAHRASVMATPDARPMGTARELLCRRRDGSEFWAEVGLSPLTTEGGNVRARRSSSRARHLKSKRQSGRLPRDNSSSSGSSPSCPRASSTCRPTASTMRRGMPFGGIGEALDLDRCAFLRIQPDGVAVAPVFWHRAGIAPPLSPSR